MPWIANDRPKACRCLPPTFLFFREVGDEWACSKCGTIFKVVEETNWKEGYSSTRKVLRRA